LKELLVSLFTSSAASSFVKGLFREGANSQPVLIPIDSAGANADVNGA
jgi:hypothetical protein